MSRNTIIVLIYYRHKLFDLNIGLSYITNRFYVEFPMGITLVKLLHCLDKSHNIHNFLSLFCQFCRVSGYRSRGPGFDSRP
jgi:hypothetical protein